MTQLDTPGGNEQFLRRFYDAVYAFRLRKAIDQAVAFAKRIDRRIYGLLLALVGTALLAIITLEVVNRGIEYYEWTNRPALQERVAAPYGLAERSLPTVDLSEYLLLPLMAGSFEVMNSELLPHLLSQCLFNSGPDEDAARPCTTTYRAEYVESNRYRAEGHTPVTVVAALFIDEYSAHATLQDLYSYSRGIGRLGNFSMTTLQPVSYYYSVTRDAYSFTWAHGPWVYSASTRDFETLRAFVESFPY